MTAGEPGQEPSRQDARLDALDERLRQAKLDEAARTGVKRAVSRPGQKQGMRILSDLVGIPFGSALIGWLIDRWMGTGPWLMLGMMFLGFGLAVRSVLRTAKEPSEGGI